MLFYGTAILSHKTVMRILSRMVICMGGVSGGFTVLTCIASGEEESRDSQPSNDARIVSTLRYEATLSKPPNIPSTVLCDTKAVGFRKTAILLNLQV